MEKEIIDSGQSWKIETVSALEFVTVDQLVRLHGDHEIVNSRLRIGNGDGEIIPSEWPRLMDGLNILLVVVIVIILYGMNRKRGRMQLLHR